jgi:hypothetical protein
MDMVGKREDMYCGILPIWCSPSPRHGNMGMDGNCTIEQGRSTTHHHHFTTRDRESTRDREEHQGQRRAPGTEKSTRDREEHQGQRRAPGTERASVVVFANTAASQP